MVESECESMCYILASATGENETLCVSNTSAPDL